MKDTALNAAASERWMLPEGIEEVLPPAAWQLEDLRQRLLDQYRHNGYELIVPPLAEFLESLLTGTGRDLDLKTFKITDQLSGRMMGIRADMTPQVARIDARQPASGVRRYCYIGTTLLTRPKTVNGSRAPVQVGCELFGSAALEADLEIIRMMLVSLAICGTPATHLELGHMGVYRAVLAQPGIPESLRQDLFDALKRRAIPEIDRLAAELPEHLAKQVCALPRLSGGPEVLDEAAALLSGTGLEAVLNVLRRVATEVQRMAPEVALHVDLGEMRGYAYHTGLTFSAYRKGLGVALAQGGRYDGVGASFGNARPATGFSMDMRVILSLLSIRPATPSAVLAPAEEDPELDALIAGLRETEVVIRRLPGDRPEDYAARCDRQIVRQGDAWCVQPFSTSP
ncbi:ATP phosphoribosyltransferase regulatory subunit [Hahella sp. SMD15-11]|uniref:ATP phosphoribosyltransferase regulatory subunit n=1 Tax=Thermohahella caldifontis TaxID=3142973 RepID=A0AB39UZU3_9GAMM